MDRSRFVRLGARPKAARSAQSYGPALEDSRCQDMRNCLLLSMVLALATIADGQPPRHLLSQAQVTQFESILQRNPRDRTARQALLGYYFQGRVDPAVAIPARRRHILWLIQNAPDDEMSGSPAATIDSKGHSLADPTGFEQAAAAWRAQVSKPNASAATLVHAGYFFKLADPGFSMDLLERAASLALSDKETSARLGDQYALVVLGVTMINLNGYPMAADPKLVDGEASKRARRALESSTNAVALAKAAYMIAWQGAVLYYSRELPFDPWPLAEAAMNRATRLAPSDREIAALSSEIGKMREEVGKQGASPKKQADQTPPTPRFPPAAGAPVAITPVAATQQPPKTSRPVSLDDLKTVSVGISREQLLKLGDPSSRVSMTDDGHLLEIFQYSNGATNLGTVRLTDGKVSSVRTF